MAEGARTSRERALGWQIEQLEARLRAAQERIDELESAPAGGGRPSAEARLRQVIDLVPHFIFAKDEDGRFLLLNKAVADAFGARVEEVLGRTDADFISDHEQVEEFRQGDLQVMQSGRPLMVPEERITDADGGLRFLQTVKIPYTESGTDRPAILGVAVDITERKRAEEKRLGLEARLLEAERLKSLGLLTGGLAHDFNNLIQIILGNLDLALDDVVEKSEAYECLEQGTIACRRASDMCNQLLAYAGQGVVSVEPLDLSAITTEICQLVDVGRLEGMELELSVADVPPVEADPSQIRQVMLNLITNALEAQRGAPGKIEVRTGCRALEAGDLETVSGDDPLPAGDYVWFEVQDHGRGMDPETARRIFDPFFSTKPSGHGLGLAAARGIVRSHRGAIHVESAVGRGTTIRVHLPVAAGAVLPVESGGPGRGLGVGEGRVLFVDDEEGVRQVVRRSLSRAGFDVTTAADGAEALEIVREHASDLALVVLDLTMPGLSGVDVLTELRGIRPDLPVLVTSGYREPRALSELRGEAPLAFLPKPFRPADLLEAIQRLLDPARGD